MKRKFISFIAAITMFAFIPSTAFSTGYPVFDASVWINAIDQLFQTYDMVQNTITQIENQYKSIQMSVERAKAIDWDNIRFDGDFDIRNDIKDANKRVNRMLTQMRNIQETLTTPSINCGNVKYSIADLCGVSSSDVGEGRKNLLTAVADYKYYMTSTMKSAVTAFEEGLSNDQKKAIWRKYGISPQNYIFIQQSQDAVMNAASKAMARVTKEAREAVVEESAKRTNAIINATMENKDSNGQPTQAGMQEAQLHLTQELVDHLLRLDFSIDQVGELVASKMIAEDAQKQAEADEAAEKAEIQSRKNSKLPSRFKL